MPRNATSLTSVWGWGGARGSFAEAWLPSLLSCGSVGDAQHHQVEIKSTSVAKPPVLVKEDCKSLQLGKVNGNFCPCDYINNIWGQRGVGGLRLAFATTMVLTPLKDQIKLNLLCPRIYLTRSVLLSSTSEVLGLLTVYRIRLFGSLPWADAGSIGMLLSKLKGFPAIPNLGQVFSWLTECQWAREQT